MGNIKHIKTFEDKTSELDTNDSISSNTKSEILKMIEELDERGLFYIFDNREDFVEERTDWDELADTAEKFYHTIDNIKSLLNKK